MQLILDIKHYETLLSVVELGTMTAAADRLLVSQSALSHRLAEAERRLGRPLFDRGPRRRLRATPATLALCQTAARVLPELQRAESDFLRSSETAVDVVRIGVGSYECYHWFPAFHVHAREISPDILLELVIVGDSPSEPLVTGAVDVVLAMGKPEGTFRSLPLFLDELVLITRPDHRLASRDWIGPETLQTESYLTYSRHPGPGFEYDRFVRASGTTPRTVTVIEQPGAIAEMIAADLGISILSRWAMTPALKDGRLAAVQCGPHGLALKWSALLHPSTTDSAPAHRIATLLADWMHS